MAVLQGLDAANEENFQALGTRLQMTFSQYLQQKDVLMYEEFREVFMQKLDNEKRLT